MRRFLGKASGFSLVEIMVTIAILGGATMLIMKQQEISTKGQVKIAKNQDLNSIVNGIQSILSNRFHCTVNFKDKSPPLEIDEIKLGKVDLEDTDNNYLSDPDEDGVAFRKEEFLGNSGYKITKIELIEVTDLTGINALKVSFAHKNDPTKETSRLFYLSAKMNGPVIDYCFSVTQTLIEQAVAQSCKAMEAEFDPETKRCQLKNLPHCFYVEEAEQCGSVYKKYGSILVDYVLLEKFGVFHNFKKKKSVWMPQCRLFPNYTNFAPCGPDAGGLGDYIPCPGDKGDRKVCREYKGHGPAIPAHDIVPRVLHRCCRHDLELGSVGGVADTPEGLDMPAAGPERPTPPTGPAPVLPYKAQGRL